MFELKPLQYAYNALEPIIDEDTVKIHHDKHHQAYANNFNKAIEGTGFEGENVEYILKNLNKIPENKRTAVRNHGGGFYNHNLYWETMIPGGAKEPVGNLKKAINDTFGSLEKFKEEFETKGKALFGSGWTSLVKKDGKLSIVNRPNQDTPISDGYVVVISNDVWEHAYYLKYQNKRDEYLSKWWSIVNWNIAEDRYNNHVNVLELETYLKNIYNNVFGREMDKEGLEYWTSKLETKSIKFKELFFNLLDEKEFLQIAPTIEMKIKKLYIGIFQREVDQEGLNFWVKKYQENLNKYGNEEKTLKYIIEEMTEGSEFKEILVKLGL